MTRDITKYIRKCPKWQKSKVTRKIKTPLTTTDTPTHAFDRDIVDTIGPLPKSENGNEYAVTLICDLTKYLVAIPIPNKNANTVAKAIFENFILKYGPMKTCITDMGTEYKNSIINDLCKYLKINNIASTALHHQTVGTDERSHRTFNEYIRSYISVVKLIGTYGSNISFTVSTQPHLWHMTIVHTNLFSVKQIIYQNILVA